MLKPTKTSKKSQVFGKNCKKFKFFGKNCKNFNFCKELQKSRVLVNFLVADDLNKKEHIRVEFKISPKV